jgi:hypothetical protein
LASKINQSIFDVLKMENWMFEGLIKAHEKYQKEFGNTLTEALKGLTRGGK